MNNVVKSLAKSKIGKVLIGAAALYVGVPMLAGAFGGAAAGAAAGQGFLGTLTGAASGAASGAAAGISQAWAGLTGAASAAMGGNLAGAGSSLATGFSPSAAMAAGGSAVPAAAAPLAVQTGAGGAGGAGAFTGQTATGFKTLAGEAGSALSQPSGLIGKMMASPYAAPAMIQTGGQLIGGVMQGYGARQEQKRQEQLTADQKLAQDTNMKTRLWPAMG